MYWLASFFPYEKARMSNELTGKIVLWRGEKQFGFIQPNDGSDDVFFHLNDFDGDEPVLNTKVAFLIEAEPKRVGQKRAAKAVVPSQ
jgi:cold shock CspA family protein